MSQVGVCGVVDESVCECVGEADSHAFSDFHDSIELVRVEGLFVVGSGYSSDKFDDGAAIEGDDGASRCPRVGVPFRGITDDKCRPYARNVSDREGWRLGVAGGRV